MILDEFRVPVIIGAGQVSDPGASDAIGPSVLDLMQTALERADADAGGGWLGRVDFLGVENQISSDVAAWPGKEPITPYLTARMGLQPRDTLLTKEPSGDGPLFLLNTAANRIATGEARVAALVGAEALRTAARRAAQAARDGATKSDTMRDLMDGNVRPILQRYGLLTPTDVYPLYESATRAAWGQSLDAAQRESAEIWSAFSEVAAGNDHAWLREPVAAEAIRTAGPSNRMITFPYTKLMVANNSVNQGAALIVTSLGLARQQGVPRSAMIHVGAGAAAHEDDDFLARDSYARSPAMAASIAGALAANGLGAQDLDHVELYSCFPCVVKMARRELGWPLDRPATVYGGLTFGGGPIGNCMMHAAAAMVGKLRAGGENGLIFANGGFATHNHTIVLTRAPRVKLRFPQDFSAQAEADRHRGSVPPLDEAYQGPGRIEALSVPYRRDGTPDFATIVARAPDGRRFLARVAREDEAGLSFLVSGDVEPVGSAGRAVAGPDDRAHWQMD